MLFRIVSVVVIVLILVAALLASLMSWVNEGLDRPMAVPEEGYILEVESGSSLSQLSRRLADLGFIDSPYPMLIQSRVGELSRIHAGEYLLEPGLSVRQMLAKLVAGDVVRFQVTFPEGRTLEQWLQILRQHPRLVRHQPLEVADVAAALKPPSGDHLEGWFFPETYTFDSRASPLSILRQAHDKMVKVLAEEWESRAADLPLDSPYEALILASIVEKETGLPAERPDIAGVFIRRLQLGMRLQTDPTVIYGLGDDYDGNLTRAHLRQQNPYNTYMIDRFPPTPIANPGRASIHAALNPADGETLYFVARGDGSHYFSRTLDEHREAVRRYQLQRVKDYRSTPQ